MNHPQWTRGVGTGIGMSDHQNSFRSGVCMGNWVETRLASSGKQLPGCFDATTTQRSDYCPQGKFGLDLIGASSSERLGRTYACTHRDLLFKHGDKARPPCSSFCSLNELTMGVPCVDVPNVQQCMWTGRNKPDAHVPLSTSRYQPLLTSQVQKWQDASFDNSYLSTSQFDFHSVTALFARHYHRCSAFYWTHPDILRLMHSRCFFAHTESAVQEAQRRTLKEAGGLCWKRESCKPVLPMH